MKIELSDDRRIITVTVGANTVTMTGQQYREILNEAGNLWAQGFEIPPIPAQPEPSGLLEATGSLRLPGGATHPEQAGAGLIVHNHLYGHSVVPLTPTDCREWGKWLLGAHPIQAPRLTHRRIDCRHNDLLTTFSH